MNDLQELIKKKKIAVFDLDGTIADTEYLHWMAHEELLKEWGVTLSRENILKYIGNNEYKIFAMMEKDFNISIDKEKAKKKRLDIFRELVTKYNILPFKKILKIIKNFKGKKIILSSQSQDIIEELLKIWEIYKYFDEIISLENSMQDKSEIIMQIGCSKDIVWFEDSVLTIKKSKSKGYDIVGVKNRYNQEIIEQYTDYIIDTVGMAKGLFVGLCTKDSVYYVDEFPEKNCKRKTTKFNTYIGGPASNAAMVFSYLGGKAIITTILGEIRFGGGHSWYFNYFMMMITYVIRDSIPFARQPVVYTAAVSSTIMEDRNMAGIDNLGAYGQPKIDAKNAGGVDQLIANVEAAAIARTASSLRLQGGLVDAGATVLTLGSFTFAYWLYSRHKQSQIKAQEEARSRLRDIVENASSQGQSNSNDSRCNINASVEDDSCA